jgi:hypothetical protein
MARTDTLGHFLTDVADAIREKKGTSETITASDFDTEIENLPSGGDLSDYFLNTIEYSSASRPGYSTLIKQLPDTPITITSTSLNYMFYNYPGSSIPSLVFTSTVTSATSMFNNCKNITTAPLFDTSSVTNTFQMFMGCSNLTTVPAYNLSSVTNLSMMFMQCKKLENVPLFNILSATDLSNMFGNGGTLLTDTSLDNILQMCISATSYTGTKTLTTLGIFAQNYPASRIQALPHYQDFIDAGWTTGF